MRNEQYEINIDHQEKQLIVTPSQVAQDLFNLKDFVNQTVTQLDSNYTIEINEVDSFIKQVKFISKIPTASLKQLSIQYDVNDYRPNLIEYKYEDVAILGEAPPQNSINDLIKQKLTMSFTNYGGMQNLKVFDSLEYFYKDRSLKKFVPAEKYKYYKFLPAGINDDEQIDDESNN
jgi:hypothetical protein